MAHAEGFFAAKYADVLHGGIQAFYSDGSDHVQMSAFECFRNPEPSFRPSPIPESIRGFQGC
ncbi:zincin-like metallopeptidase domain-containing protein [Silicimonas sp. MF1-12-2]|uniref:zincin-like metallopeptidase domain-containing protein n=1 Tax=Silicimonas sp. MF1-12-2 TaxID=3384793 RepID=UPI0039B5CAE0